MKKNDPRDGLVTILRALIYTDKPHSDRWIKGRLLYFLLMKWAGDTALRETKI